MKIAITMNRAKSGEEVPRVSQNEAYVRYVATAGMTPILIPREADPDVIAEMCDGLLLPGGIDIDPLYYGFSNHGSFYIDPEKDHHERQLLHAFRLSGKKVFGICRGMQLIFREYLKYETEMERTSGKQYSEIPISRIFGYREHVNDHAQTSDLNVRRQHPTHLVWADLDELFSTNGIGKELYPVNSMHHQACVYNHGVINAIRLIDQKDGKLNIPADFNAEATMNQAPYRDGQLKVVAFTLRGTTIPKLKTKNITEAFIAGHYSVIEAFKIRGWGGPGAGEIMAVQWHPEELGTVEMLVNFFREQAEGPKIKLMTR